MSRTEGQPADWGRMLKARVYRNQALDSVTPESGGSLEVILPIKVRWYMRPPVSLIFPFRKTQRILLDPIGARVFSACEDARTVEELVDWFAEAEDLTFHEARLLLSGYLSSLMQNGLIALEMPTA